MLTIRSIADTEKIIGHSLNGIKFTRNPVNTERTAIAIKIPAIKVKTFFANLLSVSDHVTIVINNPIKIKAKPSKIHSIVIISLLSKEISPKSLTIPAVGNRWATPHTRVSNPEI